MYALPIALLWAGIFAVFAAVLGAVRSDDERGKAALYNAISTFVVALIVDWIIFYNWMPAMSFPKIIFPIVINLLIAGILGAVIDICAFDCWSAGLTLKWVT